MAAKAFRQADEGDSGPSPARALSRAAGPARGDRAVPRSGCPARSTLEISREILAAPVPLAAVGRVHRARPDAPRPSTQKSRWRDATASADAATHNVLARLEPPGPGRPRDLLLEIERVSPGPPGRRRRPRRAAGNRDRGPRPWRQRASRPRATQSPGCAEAPRDSRRAWRDVLHDLGVLVELPDVAARDLKVDEVASLRLVNEEIGTSGRVRAARSARTPWHRRQRCGDRARVRAASRRPRAPSGRCRVLAGPFERCTRTAGQPA